ncbi:hypothetical protein IMSAGC012_00244 [Lachnospiraceae bacterium]|nr:hypothetical protein IMSAGC012_00244 [Lachnospiraceae bacterium]
MSVLDQILTLEEKKKLENMFTGDQSRDASDKIRGFLFQDLVAIDQLLNEETECVCLEFLEDVDVFCKDSTLKFIQVKYLPKSDPVKKEVMTDLYYQFLRTEILGLQLKPKMQLIIHGKSKMAIPDHEEMKLHVNCTKAAKPKAKTNPMDWLAAKVYSSNKKEEQKKRLFDQEANEKSIQKFLDRFDFIPADDIVTYQENVAEKLHAAFPSANEDEEKRKKILLGLAIEYIQKRYLLDEPNLDDLKIVKEDFLEFIRQTMKTKTEEQISAYLNSLVADAYLEIITNNPDLKTEDVQLLNQIARNTQFWISELAKTKEGQYKVIYTVSYDSYETVEKFKTLDVSGRIIKIAEVKDNFLVFLDFLWKTMLNLCRNKIDFHIENDADMLKPQYYIDDTAEKYICLTFTKDIARTGIILPLVRNVKKKTDEKNIFSRMYRVRPEKWYMSGAKYGKCEYDYNVTQVASETGDHSVAVLEPDAFYVECMDCIKIDENEWENIENCENNIFAKMCIQKRGIK